MRIKTILCSMAALAMTSAITSCQNEETVKMPANEPTLNMTDCQKVSLKIGVPSELKTRAGETPTLTYGSDGLYNFSRTVDKLWYAVYNKGNLIYDSFEAGIPQAIYNSESESFMLDILIPKINEEINLADYSVFFFAGNALDKVQNSEITDGIGLDFANKTLYAYPALLNKSVADGDYFKPQQYDYFSKYATLDDIVDSEFTGSVTLTRPFCQVSLLTDELVHNGILRTYASDGKVTVDATPSVFTQKESSTSETLPYGWNYGTDELILKDLSQSTFTLNGKAITNVDGSLTIPQVVTFKSRNMYCIGSYLMLAPDSRKAYNAGSTMEQFSFAINVTGDLNSTDANLTTDIPTGGLKANEKYVIYNKQFDPENPEEGGGHGVLSTHYVLDIVVDPTWEGTQDISWEGQE